VQTRLPQTRLSNAPAKHAYQTPCLLRSSSDTLNLLCPHARDNTTRLLRLGRPSPPGQPSRTFQDLGEEVPHKDSQEHFYDTSNIKEKENSYSILHPDHRSDITGVKTTVPDVLRAYVTRFLPRAPASMFYWGNTVWSLPPRNLSSRVVAVLVESIVDTGMCESEVEYWLSLNSQKHVRAHDHHNDLSEIPNPICFSSKSHVSHPDTTPRKQAKATCT
jgi:hypothetical protein